MREALSLPFAAISSSTLFCCDLFPGPTIGADRHSFPAPILNAPRDQCETEKYTPDARGPEESSLFGGPRPSLTRIPFFFNLQSRVCDSESCGAHAHRRGSAGSSARHHAQARVAPAGVGRKRPRYRAGAFQGRAKPERRGHGSASARVWLLSAGAGSADGRPAARRLRATSGVCGLCLSAHDVPTGPPRVAHTLKQMLHSYRFRPQKVNSS